MSVHEIQCGSLCALLYGKFGPKLPVGPQKKKKKERKNVGCEARFFSNLPKNFSYVHVINSTCTNRLVPPLVTIAIGNQHT